jgi:hypothetical protein
VDSVLYSALGEDAPKTTAAYSTLTRQALFASSALVTEVSKAVTQIAVQIPIKMGNALMEQAQEAVELVVNQAIAPCIKEIQRFNISPEQKEDLTKRLSDALLGFAQGVTATVLNQTSSDRLLGEQQQSPVRVTHVGRLQEGKSTEGQKIT